MEFFDDWDFGDDEYANYDNDVPEIFVMFLG